MMKLLHRGGAQRDEACPPAASGGKPGFAVGQKQCAGPLAVMAASLPAPSGPDSFLPPAPASMMHL